MGKPLNPEREAELERLRAHALLFLDFLRDTRAEEGSIGPYVEVVRSTYEKQDLSGMRMICSDFDNWLRDLPRPAQDAFNTLLVRATGDDLEAERATELVHVGRVVARGEILSDQEYALLEERANEIYDDPSSEAELAKINNLLGTYYATRRAQPRDRSEDSPSR